jgi:hypothetical protein
VKKQVVGSIPCTSKAFGSDPDFDKYKMCFCVLPPTPVPPTPVPPQCGPRASCKPICGITYGLCTYDDDSWKAAKSAVNPTHYGDPKNGCKSDEEDISVDGIKGHVCSFGRCHKEPCPTDVPEHVKGTPSCSITAAGGGPAINCILTCTDTPFTPCCDSTGKTVAQDECDSWIDMFDKTGGTDWAECSDARQNPCDCKSVTCSAGSVSHIVAM